MKKTFHSRTHVTDLTGSRRVLACRAATGAGDVLAAIRFDLALFVPAGVRVGRRGKGRDGGECADGGRGAKPAL